MPSDQGHTPPPTTFRILVGGTDLQFREVSIVDPVPTGRQIIEAAGRQPSDKFSVQQWLAGGDLKVLNLDETTDLRGPGVEKFLVERSATAYFFEVDGRRNQWPSETISRDALLAVAEQDPAQFSVWQELKDQPDREVLTGHPARLGTKGVERFYTVVTHTTEGQ